MMRISRSLFVALSAALVLMACQPDPPPTLPSLQAKVGMTLDELRVANPLIPAINGTTGSWNFGSISSVMVFGDDSALSPVRLPAEGVGVVPSRVMGGFSSSPQGFGPAVPGAVRLSEVHIEWPARVQRDTTAAAHEEILQIADRLAEAGWQAALLDTGDRRTVRNAMGVVPLAVVREWRAFPDWVSSVVLVYVDGRSELSCTLVRIEDSAARDASPDDPVSLRCRLGPLFWSTLKL